MRNSGIVIERVSIGEETKSDEVDVVIAEEEELKSKETTAPEKLCEAQYVEIEPDEPVSGDFRADLKGVLADS